MAGYLQALADIDDLFTHVLVIQDDAVPCKHFASALERAIEEKPDGLICLFLARLPAKAAKIATRAAAKGKRFIEIREDKIVPVVATVWPVAMAVEFREWAQTARLAGSGRSDDGAVARWSHRQKKTVYVTVPSLVQHPDEAPSTIGRRAMWGKDSSRVALLHVEDGNDW